MRGYGKSEPVDGEFSHLSDLVSLLDHLAIHEHILMMGCSIGGGLAMDFTLNQLSRVSALIMVDSGPSGLDLKMPTPVKFTKAEKAFQTGDLNLVAEIETQIWFDGVDLKPKQVNQTMRKLFFEMDRNVLDLETRKLGKRLPDNQEPAFDRLDELDLPVLIIAGDHDTPYILAAADYMHEKIRNSRKVIMEEAAHLPNMSKPELFREIVNKFLAGLG